MFALTWACSAAPVVVQPVIEPPDPPFLGCMTSRELSERLAASAQDDLHHEEMTLDVFLNGQIPVQMKGVWRLRSEQPRAALWVQLEPNTKLEHAMIRQDGQAFAPACIDFDDASGELQLRLERALSPTDFVVELSFRSEQAEWLRQVPLEQPLRVSRYAEFGALNYVNAEHWYPRVLGATPAASVSLRVHSPASWLVSASGRLASVREGPTGAVHEFVLDAALPAGVSLAFVALADAHEELVTTPRASTSVRLLRVAAGAEPTFDVRAFDALVWELDKSVGLWPHGSMTLAALPPSADELFSAHGGLMLLSPKVLDGETGMSYLFDLLARQYLSLHAPIDPRLLEGMIRYLGLRWGLRDQTPAAAEALQSMREDYLAAIKAAPKQDLPLAELSVFDALYLPIVYSKGVLVMRMLDLTLGEQLFERGLRAFVQAEAGAGSLGVDALEAAMEEGSGLELEAFFDFFFRSRGALAVEARCRDGELELAQKGGVVYPLVVELWVDGLEQALRVEFSEKGRWSTPMACPKKKLNLRAPQALLVFR